MIEFDAPVLFAQWATALKGASEQLKKKILANMSKRAATLLELLDIKFGHVPADIEQQVRTATASQLEAWTRRFVTANTLDDIFA